VTKETMAPSRSRTRARTAWIDKAAARLARLGADPEDDEELRQKKSLLVLMLHPDIDELVRLPSEQRSR
jgi:hypothetical protein